jgi:hypothetical protein
MNSYFILAFTINYISQSNDSQKIGNVESQNIIE